MYTQYALTHSYNLRSVNIDNKLWVSLLYGNNYVFMKKNNNLQCVFAEGNICQYYVLWPFKKKKQLSNTIHIEFIHPFTHCCSYVIRTYSKIHSHCAFCAIPYIGIVYLRMGICTTLIPNIFKYHAQGRVCVRCTLWCI